MDINIKNMKLFSTAEEKEAARIEQLRKDAMYGKPENELTALYTVARVGTPVFHIVTAASTAAFVYRVLFSHLAELGGEWLGAALALLIAIPLALAIEWVIAATWKPAAKKLLTLGKLDVWLFTLAIIFTCITFIAALSGVSISAENAAGELQQESITAVATQHNDRMAAIDKEITALQAGKVKGYSWKGKPTDKAIARIDALQREKETAAAALTTTAATTKSANDTRAAGYDQKIKKAQSYLARLAILCEIMKLIMYFVLGYYSRELMRWYSGETKVKGVAITQEDDEDTAPTPPLPHRRSGYSGGAWEEPIGFRVPQEKDPETMTAAELAAERQRLRTAKTRAKQAGDLVEVARIDLRLQVVQGLLSNTTVQ